MGKTLFKIIDHSVESGLYQYAEYDDGVLRNVAWSYSRPDFIKKRNIKEEWDEAVIGYQKEHEDIFPKSKAAKNIEKLEKWLAKPIDFKREKTSHDDVEKSEKGETESPKEKMKNDLFEVKEIIVQTIKEQCDPKNILKTLMTPLIEALKKIIEPIDKERAITGEKTARLRNKELRKERRKMKSDDPLGSEENDEEIEDMDQEGAEDLVNTMTGEYMDKLTDVVSMRDKMSEKSVKGIIKQGQELIKSEAFKKAGMEALKEAIIVIIGLLGSLAAAAILMAMMNKKEAEAEEASLEKLRPDEEKLKELIQNNDNQKVIPTIMSRTMKNTDNQ